MYMPCSVVRRLAFTKHQCSPATIHAKVRENRRTGSTSVSLLRSFIITLARRRRTILLACLSHVHTRVVVRCWWVRSGRNRRAIRDRRSLAAPWRLRCRANWPVPNSDADGKVSGWLRCRPECGEARAARLRNRDAGESFHTSDEFDCCCRKDMLQVRFSEADVATPT